MNKISWVFTALLLALLVFTQTEVVHWQNLASLLCYHGSNQTTGAAPDDPWATILAVLTVAIIAFQAWNGVRQNTIGERQLSIVNRQMEITAAQTDLMIVQKEIARQTFIVTHRAKIHAQSFRCFVSSDGTDATVQYSFVNRGATDGSVTSESLATAYLDAPGDLLGLPWLPPTQPGPFRIAPGEIIPVIKTGLTINSDALDAGKFLHVYGAIDYTDENGNHHRTGFLRCYERRIDRFLRVSDPDGDFEYEY